MKKNCVICDAEFESIRNNHVCCSSKCGAEKAKLLKRELYGKDWTKTCVVCGITYQNKAHNSRTCSKSCQLEDRKNQRKVNWKKQPSRIQPAIKRMCECGKEFEAVGLGRTRISCSDECAKKRRSEQASDWHEKTKVLQIRKCDFCSTTFNPTGKQRICLSDECKKKLSREYSKKYYKTPPAEKKRAYRNRNKDRINAYMRDYHAKRRQEPKHRLSARMYRAVRSAVKEFKVSTTKTIQGLYTNEELFNHLESQFTDGMSWDNMSEWHIDHIRPIASFNYDSTEHPEFKECWALENLQPLWATDNMSKGSVWEGKRRHKVIQ